MIILDYANTQTKAWLKVRQPTQGHTCSQEWEKQAIDSLDIVDNGEEIVKHNFRNSSLSK